MAVVDNLVMVESEIICKKIHLYFLESLRLTATEILNAIVGRWDGNESGRWVGTP